MIIFDSCKTATNLDVINICKDIFEISNFSKQGTSPVHVYMSYDSAINMMPKLLALEEKTFTTKIFSSY